MKKLALSTAALLALVSPLAHAQSSATLYGIIDAGVTYFSNLNGHSAFVANDGSIQSNRWGLRGIEDIGGGSRVIFDLESGFNLYSGHDGAVECVSAARHGWGLPMTDLAGLRSASSTTSSGTISRSLQWAQAPVSTRGIPATSITWQARCTSITRSNTRHRAMQDSRLAHCMRFLPNPYQQEQDG
jgi:hypothetical protein